MYIYIYIYIHIYIYIERERDAFAFLLILCLFSLFHWSLAICPRDVCIRVHTYRCLWKDIPPEKNTRGKISFQNTKSEAEEQFLMPDRRAEAHLKIFVHRHQYGLKLWHVKYIYIYIYIYREREREIKTLQYICILDYRLYLLHMYHVPLYRGRPHAIDLSHPTRGHGTEW